MPKSLQNRVYNQSKKISMLVHKFCAPPPAIQQQKPSSGAKKIYSTKLKIFFFHSSKIEEPNQQPLSYEKTNLWCFACLITKTCLFIVIRNEKIISGVARATLHQTFSKQQAQVGFNANRTINDCFICYIMII